MAAQENKPLLPDIIKKPALFFWTTIAPQIAFLLGNCFTLWLVSSEASSQTLSTFGALFAVQIALLALSFGAWYPAGRQRTFIRWPWYLVLFFGQIGYLWFFAFNLRQVIPADVDRWIVDEGMLMFYAFSLMMPGIFYSGIQLACFELPISRLKNLGVSLLLTFVAPALFYLFFVATSFLARGGGSFFYQFLWPFFFIVLTVLMFIGLIRLMALLYNWVSERGELGQMLFAIAIGIAGPVAGLSLNRLIPFPTDFQSLAVYVMAILNGVIVLLPRVKRGAGGILFLRASTYPFTLYFFLVFLPFLPLALIAMFAMGSGFLILIPVLLFMLHTKKLADDFKASAPGIGVKVSIAVLILGLSLLPGYFLHQAYSDKRALSQALRYSYFPDYGSEQNFNGDLKTTRQVLLNLKRFKEGIQLPYISALYNRIVFEGMVLPDEKIVHMFYIFTGEDINSLPRVPGWQAGPGMFFDRAQGRMWGGMGGLSLPERTVVLESVQSELVELGDYQRATLKVTMRNAGTSNNAEFVAAIDLPPAVAVTGFSLRVGEQMVPGKIFERRAALWVYHMIRDFVRRDPGVLFYTNPGQLELRIYPFTLEETREAQIEIEFPANASPFVQIGEKTLELRAPEPLNDEALSGQDTRGNRFLFISEAQLKTLPSVRRKPYLHIIVDRSQSGLESLSGYAEHITALAAQYPEAACRIVAANFSLEEAGLVVDPRDKDAVIAALRQIQLPRQGGLDLERAIKTSLVRYALNLRHPENDAEWQTFPVFVVVTPDKTKISRIEGLDFYRELIPETAYCLVVSSPQDIEKRLLWERSFADEQDRVIVFGLGRQRAVVAANAAEPAVAYFTADDEDTAAEFEVFDPEQNRFAALGAVKRSSPRNEFINRLSLVWNNKQALLNPLTIEESLAGFVEASRSFSVLIPSTTFIVVERGAQWKALQLSEQQRLSTSGAFEFEEEFKTPAPSLLTLLTLFALCVVLKRRSHRAREMSIEEK